MCYRLPNTETLLLDLAPSLSLVRASHTAFPSWPRQAFAALRRAAAGDLLPEHPSPLALSFSSVRRDRYTRAANCAVRRSQSSSSCATRPCSCSASSSISRYLREACQVRRGPLPSSRVLGRELSDGRGRHDGSNRTDADRRSRNTKNKKRRENHDTHKDETSQYSRRARRPCTFISYLAVATPAKDTN